MTACAQVLELRIRTHRVETRARGDERQRGNGDVGPVAAPATTTATGGDTDATKINLDLNLVNRGRRQDWTRCPKMHHDVQEALAFARELAERARPNDDDDDGDFDTTSSPGKEADALVVEDCLRRLNEVSSQLRRMDLPSFARPAATLAMRSTNLARVEETGLGGAGGGDSKAGAIERAASDAMRIPSAASRAKPSREVQMHQDLHEDLSAEILELAQGLKSNALKFKDKLGVQAKQLDQAEENLEKNVDSVKK